MTAQSLSLGPPPEGLKQCVSPAQLLSTCVLNSTTRADGHWLPQTFTGGPGVCCLLLSRAPCEETCGTPSQCEVVSLTLWSLPMKVSDATTSLSHALRLAAEPRVAEEAPESKKERPAVRRAKYCILASDEVERRGAYQGLERRRGWGRSQK